MANSAWNWLKKTVEIKPSADPDLERAIELAQEVRERDRLRREALLKRPETVPPDE